MALGVREEPKSLFGHARVHQSARQLITEPGGVAGNELASRLQRLSLVAKGLLAESHLGTGETSVLEQSSKTVDDLAGPTLFRGCAHEGNASVERGAGFGQLAFAQLNGAQKVQAPP